MKHTVFYDQVGGFTNGRFWISIWVNQGVEVSWYLPTCVTLSLGDALNPKVKIHVCLHPLSEEGELGTF